MEELPHEMLFETFIFSDEERMNPAKQRSADGAFMKKKKGRGERKRERERESEREAGGKKKDKSTPKAIWM